MTRFFTCEQTSATPQLSFDLDSGRIVLAGESFPENALSFYRPLIENLREHMDEVHNLVVEINLSYLNTTTIKSLIDFFDICEEMYSDGKNVRVIWYYHEDDDRSLEIAEELFEDITLPYQTHLVNAAS